MYFILFFIETLYNKESISVIKIIQKKLVAVVNPIYVCHFSLAFEHKSVIFTI